MPVAPGLVPQVALGTPYGGEMIAADGSGGASRASLPTRGPRGRRVLAAVVVVLAAALLAVGVRAMGWWPATYRSLVTQAQAGDTWPFPSTTAQLVCRRHWFGRDAASVVVQGGEYGLDGHAIADGLPSAVDAFVTHRDRAAITPYLIELNRLTLGAQQQCKG